MKLGIVTALNERPRISRIMLNCFERLRSEYSYLHSPIELFAAVHNDEDHALVDEYGGTAIKCEGNVAGHKFNRALYEAVLAGCDWFLIMGDDDAISSALIYHWKHFNRVDYFGLRSNAYVNLQGMKAMQHTYKPKNKLIGAGRFISQTAILNTCFPHLVEFIRDYDIYKVGHRTTLRPDQSDYLREYGYIKVIDSAMYVPLWPTNAKKSLDHFSELRLVMAGYVPEAIESSREWNGQLHITDFKSRDETQNIWPYSILEDKCKPITFEDATWFLSDKEREYILTLKK
jgi:hypothetical protein